MSLRRGDTDAHRMMSQEVLGSEGEMEKHPSGRADRVEAQSRVLRVLQAENRASVFQPPIQ